MYFAHRAFWLPKDIQDPNGYEDAFEIDNQRGLAAVCDGASSTIFSGRWSAMIAKGVVWDTPPVHDAQAMQVWLKRYREAWSSSIDETALAWHQKPKLLDGAATTVLWVQLSPLAMPGTQPLHRLQVFAVGDCCLFHVRDGQLLRTFPITESQRFDAHPQVLRSVFKRSDAVSFAPLDDQCRDGDWLVLCTDALAAWLMRQAESGQPLDWQAYWNMSAMDWQQWIVGLRQANQIRYDDSTLVILRVGQTESPSLPDEDDEEIDISVRETSEDDDNLLHKAEEKLRGAWKSLKGSVRKGLSDLSRSKWLQDDANRNDADGRDADRGSDGRGGDGDGNQRDRGEKRGR
jgi:hypothetical protein